MITKTDKPKLCHICGEKASLGHALLAHGPLATGDTLRKRRKVRSVLPELYRRLEKAGFNEVDADRIDYIVTQLLKEKGLT